VPLAVPFGFAVGHAVAYLVAPPGAHDTAAGGHGYLGSVTVVGSVLMLVAMGGALLAGARHDDYRPRWRALAAQLCVAYAVIEMVEHLAAGHELAEVLRAPSLWVGLLVQLAVAAGLVALLRAAHRVGTSLARVAAPVPRRSSPLWVFELALVAGVPLTSIRRRGPPIASRSAH